MKIHNFVCFSGHEFQAWYKTSAECQQHLSAGCISCPVCGSEKIRHVGEPVPFALDAEDLKVENNSSAEDDQAAELLSSLISSAKRTAKERVNARKQWLAASAGRSEANLFRRIGIQVK